jgi:hypothetical protein
MTKPTDERKTTLTSFGKPQPNPFIGISDGILWEMKVDLKTVNGSAGE